MRVLNMRFYKVLHKVLLWKAYFEKGMSLLNYPIKALMVIGIGAAVQKYSLVGIALWSVAIAVFALLLGKVWFYYKLIEIENEIQNIFNPFCRDVRKNLKRRFD